MKRSFVLHVGPTNSGKTYDAIEDLKKNTPGTYLGPLRLLALEMFDKINAAGIPCSMLTGEESIPVKNAQIVSSTIELCDYHTHFKTAVIDEAQLIADPDRGAAWLAAIHHHPTALAVAAERGALVALEGSCRTAIGAYAQVDQAGLRLVVEALTPDGRERFRREASLALAGEGDEARARQLGLALGGEIREEGGDRLLLPET